MEQKYLAKIIMYMKQRFQKDENTPISLDDILKNLNIDDLPTKSRLNLDKQILIDNPKLEHTTKDGLTKYTYKPTHVINGRKDLINLIKEQQNKGLGGILMEDVQESMTNDEYERFSKKPGDDIEVVIGKSKKKVLFYNDKKSADNLVVDEEIIKYWRDVPVEGLDETKIDEYLEKKGFTFMKDEFANANKSQFNPADRRKTHKGRQTKKHNDHLGNLLNEYDPTLVRKPNPK